MTKNDKFDKADCIFSTDGDVIGRILKKSKIYKRDEYYSYDIEISKVQFEKLKSVK